MDTPQEALLGERIEALENSNSIERSRPERLPISTSQIESLKSPRLGVSRTFDDDVISRRSSCGVSIHITRTNSTGTLIETDFGKQSLSETDLRYTNKDLSEYLGMKDQISKSILQHEVYILGTLNRYCVLNKLVRNSCNCDQLYLSSYCDSCILRNEVYRDQPIHPYVGF